MLVVLTAAIAPPGSPGRDARLVAPAGTVRRRGGRAGRGEDQARNSARKVQARALYPHVEGRTNQMGHGPPFSPFLPHSLQNENGGRRAPARLKPPMMRRSRWRRRREDAHLQVGAHEAFDLGTGGREPEGKREDSASAGSISATPAAPPISSTRVRSAATSARSLAPDRPGRQGRRCPCAESRRPIDRGQDHRAEAHRADRGGVRPAGPPRRCRPHPEAGWSRWTATTGSAILRTRLCESGARRCGLRLIAGGHPGNARGLRRKKALALVLPGLDMNAGIAPPLAGSPAPAHRHRVGRPERR